MRALVVACGALLIAGSCVMLDPIIPDVPLDGGTDGASAEPDAPRDVRRTDSPEAEVAGDPEWVIPPGVPADCRVERARHPERLPALAWAPCGDGCTRADLGTVWNAESGFRVEGQLWFELLSDDFGPGTRTDALVPATGLVLDGWRHVESSEADCLMSTYEAAGGRAASMVLYIGDRDAIVLEDRFWLFGLDERPADVAPDVELVAPLVGNTRATEEFVISSSLLAFRIAYGTVVVSYGGELTEVFPRLGFDLVASGDQLLFVDVGPAWQLMQWTPAGGTESFYDPPEPVSGLRLDGTTLAWQRMMDFAGPRATRAELWTGELVRDPAAFVPRLVNDRVEPDGVLGAGMYAWDQVTAGRAEVHLIDLDTGRHRVLPSPAGLGCRALVVSREEVVLACNDFGTPVRRSIYRLDPDVHAAAV